MLGRYIARLSLGRTSLNASHGSSDIPFLRLSSDSSSASRIPPVGVIERQLSK